MKTSLLPLLLVFTAAPAVAQSAAARDSAAHDQYVALTLPGVSAAQPVREYGVPFSVGKGPALTDRPTVQKVVVAVGATARRIFLLGMTEAGQVHAWADPRNQAVRYWIGETVGRIQVEYADGETQVFPLVLGESLWWGKEFYEYPHPFAEDARFRDALKGSLRLYPAKPVEDGRYLAVIEPRPKPIRSVTITNVADKQGPVAIDAITVETKAGDVPAGATGVPVEKLDAEVAQFFATRALRSEGRNEAVAKSARERLARSLYTSDADLVAPVAVSVPAGYKGPKVSFKGDHYAAILTNAFYANVDDILAKVDDAGMYHTSTKDATNWGGRGFGTFKTNAGLYYDASWTRDLGRSLREITDLGYFDPATRCASYCLREARLWTERADLLFKGQQLPDHWSRIANRPDAKEPFENDGHGLISLYLYDLWQHLPDRREWLTANWPDVEKAGDWILWQFDHPDISGAKDGVLFTTGEAAGGKGYSVYANYVCMDALKGLARMAESIGHDDAAKRWNARAAAMHDAMAQRYIVDDPKYGRVWTLKDAGWPNNGTVLGPTIFLADFAGLAPEDDDPAWRAVNLATYRRAVEMFATPKYFYGQAMGYGQGFVTEAALLLDQMHDAEGMLNWTAKEIYDPKYKSFIVAEGVQAEPDGRFWYRVGDLGNGVQEGEIVKVMRVLIGLDDVKPDRVRVFPRMPYGWTEMDAKDMPVMSAQAGEVTEAHLSYTLRRQGPTMVMTIGADRPLGEVEMRLGPFAAKPGRASVVINGKSPAEMTPEQSGDSWWARFTMPVGALAAAAR